MDRIVSPNGVKANMRCASCLYSEWVFTYKRIKKLCTKKNKSIIDGHDKCGYYVMAKFFQERGYKMIKD